MERRSSDVEVLPVTTLEIGRKAGWIDMIRYWPLVGLIAIAPSVATYVCIEIYLNSSISDFVPSVWNDQTGYWHQILTFSRVGFAGGYYTHNEMAHALDFFRFDDYGPIFIPLYGTIARVIGWHGYSGILVNMILVGAAIALFVLTMKLDRLQALLTGCLVLSFWPILLYLPTSSQESFHQAVALVLGAFFCRLLRNADHISVPFTLLFFLFLLAVSLIRTSWALLSVPFFMLTIMGAVRRREARQENRAATPIPSEVRRRYTSLLGLLILSLLLGGVFITGVFAVMRSTSAPENNSIVTVVEGSYASLDGIRSLVTRSYRNLRGWLSLSPFDIYGAQRLFVSGLIVYLLVGTAVGVVRLRTNKSPAPNPPLPELLFHLYNLTSIFVGTVTVYLVAGAFRVVGAHLLLSLALAVKFRRFATVGAAIILNLLVTSSFLAEYQQWKPNFAFARSQLMTLGESVKLHMAYDPEAKSPWCNTVLIPVEFYDYRVTLIPAGMGVSFIHGGNPGQLPKSLQLPLKSQYLLLNKETYEMLAATGKLNIQPLATLPIGWLLRNRDSAC